MNETQKKLNVICIFSGPTSRPDKFDFKERYLMLSESFQGEVYSWSNNPEFREYSMGDFTFKADIHENKVPGKLSKIIFIAKSALAFNKKKKVDLIICYDPVFTGFIGVFLKLALGSKLIVELNNSNMQEAILMEMGDSFKARAKIFLFKLLRAFTLRFTDGIKLLTENQRDNLEIKYQQKKVFCFHDFVPTHYFSERKKRMDNYILFVGYPFHRKGIDLLVQAFERIENEFPEMELLLIGHRLIGEANNRLGEWSSRIKFLKPMYYDELREYFLNCYCFILPSREEGMGRVLLEAMASEKAVIGCNVGGIPGLITDGVNGLLFEKEDVDGLVNQMRVLLSNKEYSQSLGKEGGRYIEQHYSSKKYCEHFTRMAYEVCD